MWKASDWLQKAVYSNLLLTRCFLRGGFNVRPGAWLLFRQVCTTWHRCGKPQTLSHKAVDSNRCLFRGVFNARSGAWLCSNMYAPPSTGVDREI
jgi:hypothetical protein